MVTAEADLEADRSSGSHWSAMNTKEPGCSGMAITKLGWEKKVNAFSRSEPPVQGLPRLFHSPRGSLPTKHLSLMSVGQSWNGASFMSIQYRKTQMDVHLTAAIELCSASCDPCFQFASAHSPKQLCDSNPVPVPFDNRQRCQATLPDCCIYAH